MPKLKFIEEGHIYDLDGVKIPSVSSVLNKIFPFPYNPLSNFYMARGRYIHSCCDLILKKSLDWDSIPEEIKEEVTPYLRAYEKYIENEKFTNEPFISERPDFHKVWKYGFTPDTFFPNFKILDDIKTGTYNRDRYGMQLIAYKEGMESQGLRVEILRTVLLKKNGEYEIKITKYKKNIFREFIAELKKLKEDLK